MGGRVVDRGRDFRHLVDRFRQSSGDPRPRFDRHLYRHCAGQCAGFHSVPVHRRSAGGLRDWLLFPYSSRPTHTARGNPGMTVTLTTEEKFLIRHAAARLRRQFEGQLNVETIERFLSDSVESLTSRAKSTMWIPLLAERFAKDRLRALIRL